MSRSLNKVMLIGNVGNDPEIKTTGGGTKIAKISLATNRVFTDRSGQQQEKTEWHRLTFWDKLADLVEQYVKKGDRLYIEGRVEYSQSEQDGVTRYFTDIVVREMVMLGSSGPGGGGGYESAPRRRQPAQGGRAATPSPFDADDDDLPF
ncbi:MAG TPA: single-stranded DNA-binding protein [Longimicrobiales bacterium]